MRGGHRPPWDPRWRRCCWPGPSREGDHPQLRGCGPCSVPAETHGLMSVPGSTGTRGPHLQTGPEPPPRPCPEPRGTRTPRTAPKTRVRPPAPRGASPGGRPRSLALACPPPGGRLPASQRASVRTARPQLRGRWEHGARRGHGGAADTVEPAPAFRPRHRRERQGTEAAPSASGAGVRPSLIPPDSVLVRTGRDTA